MPFEVEVHTAPHFKAPVNGKIDPKQLEFFVLTFINFSMFKQQLEYEYISLALQMI